MEVTFDHSEIITPNIKTFWFCSSEKLDYTAGQFIELYIPHSNYDNRGQKRWFTLSSSPTEQLLAITTRFTNRRSSTFKQQLFGLKPGNKVLISQSMGDFVLPRDPQVPLVFVAAGVGITPVRSMLTWLTDKNEQRMIHVIYGVRNVQDIAFGKLLEKSSVKTEIILSQPDSSWSGLKGSLDASLVINLVSDIHNKLVYVSGPELFVEKLASGLTASGVSGDRLVLDFYHGYKAT